MKDYNKYKKIRSIYRFFTIFFLAFTFFFGFKFCKNFLVSAAANTVIGTNEKIDGDPISFLILGTDTDSVQASGARSDVMMVATLNPKNSRNNMEIDMVSIPRDVIMLNTCSGEYVKSNSIFNFGYSENNDVQAGIACIESSIENFLDIEIDYHFESSFDGLIALVDAIGGIEINVDKSMHAPDSQSVEDAIVLEPGIQTLDGEQALGYARERYETSDYDRNRRQREIMAAITSKILSDPSEYADDLFTVYNEYVTSNLKFSKIRNLLSVVIDAFNMSLKNLSNDKKIIFDKKTSALEMENQKETFEFNNEEYSDIENVDDVKSLDTLYETPEMYLNNPIYDEIAKKTLVDRRYISKEITNYPTSSSDSDIELFGIEFQSYTMAVEEINIPGVEFTSYASPYSLNYTSNLLKTSLEQPIKWNTNFNYNVVSNFSGPSADLIYQIDEVKYEVDYTSIYENYDIYSVPENEKEILKRLGIEETTEY